MTEISAIETFIKKYRAATASKSKDMRISIEEANDVIAAFASINTNNNDLITILKSIKKEISELKEEIVNPNVDLDGGSF